jgi:hypothetical protein
MAGAKPVRRSKRDCVHCGRPFKPKSGRQIYCKDPECARRRRYKYWRRYIEGWKRRNPTYWENYLRKWRRENPNYFREWRRRHPDYFKEWYRKNKERLRRRRASRRGP